MEQIFLRSMKLPDRAGMLTGYIGVPVGQKKEDATVSLSEEPDNLDSQQNVNTLENSPPNIGKISSHIYQNTGSERYRLDSLDTPDWLNSNQLVLTLKSHNGTRPEIFFDARMMIPKSHQIHQLLPELVKILGKSERKNFPMLPKQSTCTTMQTNGSPPNKRSRIQSSSTDSKICTTPTPNHSKESTI